MSRGVIMKLPKVGSPVVFEYIDERGVVVQIKGSVSHSGSHEYLEINVKIPGESPLGNTRARKRSYIEGTVSLYRKSTNECSPLYWVVRAPNSRILSRLHGRIVVGVSWDPSYEYVKQPTLGLTSSRLFDMTG